MYHDKRYLLRQRRRMEVLKELLPSDSLDSNRLLDVGCGDGYLASDLLQGMNDFEYFGIDLSNAKLRSLRSRIKPVRGVLLADAESLPFYDGGFHVVLCSEVLEHLPSPERTLSEIHRVLSDDGMLLLSVPVDSSLQLAWNRLRRLLPGSASAAFHEHIHLFTLRGIRRLLEQHGFSIVRDELCSFCFPFDSIVFNENYRLYARLDKWLCGIPIEKFGIGSKISVSLGREYFVALSRKVSNHPGL